MSDGQHPPVTPPVETRRGFTRWWVWVQEPRMVSILHCVVYVILAVGGAVALAAAPVSIQQEAGTFAMHSLAALTALGGILGAVATLPGVYWLERVAVFAIGIAATIYTVILLSIQSNGGGNRGLQIAFILAVGLLHAVRWQRIKERPNAPLTPAPPPTRTVGH